MAIRPPIPPAIVSPLGDPLRGGALPWESVWATRSRTRLDLFAGGTFTRSTEGSYLTAADALAWAGVNERRLEYDAGLPGGSGLLIEGSRQNELLRSRELTDAAWIAGTATTTADQATSPDGTTSAERVNAASGQLSPYQTLAGTGIKTLSAWVRAVAGSVSHQVYISDGASALANFASIGATWTRRDLTKTVSTGPATVVCCDGRDLTASGGQVATAQDIYADLIQFEPGAFPTSAIRTTTAAVTRGADVLTYAVGQYPASFLAIGFRLRFVPNFASTDIPTSAIYSLIGTSPFGSGEVAIYESGGIYLGVNKGDGSGTEYTASALSWSRGQVLTIEARPGVSLTTSGFTTGNQTKALTGGPWASGGLTIGLRSNATAPFFGRFGRYIEAL